MWKAPAACKRARRERRPVVSESIALLSDVDDCWNRIGIRGDKSCGQLAGHVHCRNCPVYATAAKRILDRLPPQMDVLDHEPEARHSTRQSSLLVFRLGRE